MKTKLTPETAKAIAILFGVVVVALLAYYIVKKFFGGLSSIGQVIGLSDSPEVVAAKTQINKALEQNSLSYWSPEYYNNAPANARILTVGSSHELCKTIHDAYGFFSYLDTPEDMEAAFKQCPSKSAVSFLVVEFQVLYNTDLMSYLNRFTDTDKDRLALARAIKYCDSLPAY